MRYDTYRLSKLLTKYETFWSGWEFAKQTNRPELFIEVKDQLEHLYAITDKQEQNMLKRQEEEQRRTEG